MTSLYFYYFCAMTRYALALALMLLAAVTAQAQDYVYDDLAASPAVDSLQAVARRNAATRRWQAAGTMPARP